MQFRRTLDSPKHPTRHALEAVLAAGLFLEPACVVPFYVDFPTTENSTSSGSPEDPGPTDGNVPTGSSGVATGAGITSGESDSSSGNVGAEVSGTPPLTCGDEVFSPGVEDCDFVGGLPQGLEASNCQMEQGFFTGVLTCNPETCEFDVSECTGICGDGIISPGEGCDDCNVSNGDGCDQNCQLESCGNGVTEDPFEMCDDGNEVNDDSCTNNCTLATCGNGVKDQGEECDPVLDESCQSNCTEPASQCGVG